MAIYHCSLKVFSRSEGYSAVAAAAYRSGSILKDEIHLDEEFLTEQFSEIAEWLYEACGIELPQDRFKFDIYENPRGKKSMPKIKSQLIH